MPFNTILSIRALGTQVLPACPISIMTQLSLLCKSGSASPVSVHVWSVRAVNQHFTHRPTGCRHGVISKDSEAGNVQSLGKIFWKTWGGCLTAESTCVIQNEAPQAAA